MSKNGMSEGVLAAAIACASIGRAAGAIEAVEASGFYEVECLGPDGQVKWRDRIDNLVTNVGKANLLDNHLAGSAYTAAWFLGLIGVTSYTTGPAAGDTSASHGGWVEDVAYSQVTRPAAAFSAATAGSKPFSSPAVFTITGGANTIKGCFLISNSTKSGTTGVLYSAGLFSGGDKAVSGGDTLNVSYTATA